MLSVTAACRMDGVTQAICRHNTPGVEMPGNDMHVYVGACDGLW